MIEKYEKLKKIIEYYGLCFLSFNHYYKDVEVEEFFDFHLIHE